MSLAEAPIRSANRIAAEKRTARDARSLVSVRDLTRVFDVSDPWLNRVIERKPK